MFDKTEIRLEFDINEAFRRRLPLCEKAQAALDTQVLKDSNLFAPKADGYLRESGRVDGPGKISYNTIYARHQYYLNDGAHYTTIGTMAKWFEHAKALYRTIWINIAQRKFD